jgi:hypothetical protein
MLFACPLLDIAVADFSERPVTGIDVGLESFLTAANGEREPAIQPFKTVL